MYIQYQHKKKVKKIFPKRYLGKREQLPESTSYKLFCRQKKFNNVLNR